MDAIRKFFDSKRNVVNLVSAGLMILQLALDVHWIPLQYQAEIVLAANLLLGMFFKGTGWSLKLSGSARQNVSMVLAVGLVLGGLMLNGCATGGVNGKVSNANTAVTTVEITNATIDGVASLAEQMCQDGTLKPDDCAKIQTAYDKVRAADSAVLHIMEAAIQAGQDPQSSPDYPAAMSDMTAAVKELFNLANQLGLIKKGA